MKKLSRVDGQLSIWRFHFARSGVYAAAMLRPLKLRCVLLISAATFNQP